MSDWLQIVIGIILLVGFYGSYLSKMFIQRKQGIQTDVMGKGSKPRKTFIIEVCLKTVTYLLVIVQLLSLFMIDQLFDLKYWIEILGCIISFLGICFFMIAIITMKDSWRAGVDHNQETTLIKRGIFKYSRNPAFLGFDLFYLGFLILFFNLYLLFVTLVAIILLHLQILEEEKFLPTVFGKEYVDYQGITNRYLGCKQNK